MKWGEKNMKNNRIHVCNMLVNEQLFLFEIWKYKFSFLIEQFH